MSNEIEVQKPTGLSVWTTDARNFFDVANYLCQTPFVPDNYKGKPEAIVAAVMFGDEIGLTPMAALQSLSDIKGKPTLSAQAMRSLVLKAGHEVWVEEQSDERVVACGRRKGSEHVSRVVWDIKRAKDMGVGADGRNGIGTLKRMPQNMLVARATSEICRLIAPDALNGLYAQEEMSDEVTEETKKPVKRTLKRKKAQPAPEEVLETETIELEETSESENEQAMGQTEIADIIEAGNE